MRVFFVALALAAGFLSAAAAQASTSCELHLWGAGYPNRKLPKRLEEHLRETNPPATFDLSNPLSNLNTFNTAKRVAALADEKIRELVPDAASVTIIRHPQMIDLQLQPTKTIKLPLAEGGSDCSADLVITNIYAIFPNPDGSYVQFLRGNAVAGGLLPDILAGGDRLVVEFWFQYYPTRGSRPFVFRRKNDSPLPHLPPNTADFAEAVKLSADLNLSGFVEAAVKHREN